MPEQRRRLPGLVSRRQRRARLEALQFYSRAGTGPQQPIGRFTQSGPRFGRIVVERRIESRQKRGDIAIDPLAENAIDECTTFLYALPVAGRAVWRRIGGGWDSCKSGRGIMTGLTLPRVLVDCWLPSGGARGEAVAGGDAGDVRGILRRGIGNVRAAAISVRQRQMQSSSRFSVLRRRRSRTRCARRGAVAGWAGIAELSVPVARV